MTITPHRVPEGVPAGGQFTSITRPEAPVQLPATPSSPSKEDFAEFDSQYGDSFAHQLQVLQTVPLQERINAGRVCDVLRESYGDYYEDGEPLHSSTEAHRLFCEHLPNLTDDRKAHYLELVGFAVHTEIKHYENPEFSLSPNHSWEMIADISNYPTSDAWAREGTEENRSHWEELANNATAHALRENEAAGRKAA